jgi:hypothetical protein
MERPNVKCRVPVRFFSASAILFFNHSVLSLTASVVRNTNNSLSNSLLETTNGASINPVRIPPNSIFLEPGRKHKTSRQPTAVVRWNDDQKTESTHKELTLGLQDSFGKVKAKAREDRNSGKQPNINPHDISEMMRTAVKPLHGKKLTCQPKPHSKSQFLEVPE